MMWRPRLMSRMMVTMGTVVRRSGTTRLGGTGGIWATSGGMLKRGSRSQRPRRRHERDDGVRAREHCSRVVVLTCDVGL